MPDFVELSQKLQHRLAEAFRSSLATTSGESGVEDEASKFHLGAYLTREAALRVSQRILATKEVSTMLHQKPARSRTRRSRFFLHSSHTLDDGSEAVSADWDGAQRRGISLRSSLRRRRNLHGMVVDCMLSFLLLLLLSSSSSVSFGELTQLPLSLHRSFHEVECLDQLGRRFI